MKSKKKKKYLFYIIGFLVLIFISILLFIFIPSQDVVFSFIYSSTEEAIDGEVYFDNVFFGFTNEGLIEIPFLEEIPDEIMFKGNYNGTDFEFFYDFPKDYWDYYSNEFLIDEINNQVQFYFYNLENNCTLDGEIYFGDKLIGNSEEGLFLLSKENYNLFWNGEVKLKGLTGDCFGKNKNLPFVEYWISDILDYYFETGEEVIFETDFNPRWPRYPEEMTGFIRPLEVKERLDKISFENDSSDLKDILKIFGYTYMNYVSDNGKFGEDEYWQTPAEFIQNKGGDCEDWAIYFLSLIRLNNPHSNCYAAVWPTHVNVICQVNQIFLIMDQEKVIKTLKLDEALTIQDNKIRINEWKNNYFDNYGLNPDERILYILFNEEEYFEFEENIDFTNWILERAELNF